MGQPERYEVIEVLQHLILKQLSVGDRMPEGFLTYPRGHHRSCNKRIQHEYCSRPLTHASICVAVGHLNQRYVLEVGLS